ENLVDGEKSTVFIEVILYFVYFISLLNCIFYITIFIIVKRTRKMVNNVVNNSAPEDTALKQSLFLFTTNT
ncbi:hypothetical protein PRIPAC_82466, partial [Pristionchus pacificus]|uniref:Uncharacterized protein n=1 Tax=Pristionchus pacificus TaxID=54126 RepID=A0A2A6C4E7_PRIPA